MVKGGRSSEPKRKKVREMRSAEKILGIIRERGKRGLPLEDIYRQLYNPTLYLMAYARLYSNEGAMTRGTTSETVDGMALKKIEQLIDDLRHERFRWTPVRRTYILKKNGKLRPLGLPTWTDKLLQEAIRLILEAYYEPQFSPHSHGFRPERGCHTALREMEQTWTGTKWYVEGDIAQCFDRLDHQVLSKILREKLHDNRFIRLIQQLLDYVSSKINTLDQQEDLVETDPLANCLPRFSVTNLHPFSEQKFAAGLHKEPVVLPISFNASTHPFTVEPDLQGAS